MMPRNFGPTSFPSIPWKRLILATFAAVAWAAVLASVANMGACTGKSIKLFSPATGKPLAEYANTTDTEIGGLEAEYDPTTGAFKIKVKSSSQSASASNEAVVALAEAAIAKIPIPMATASPAPPAPPPAAQSEPTPPTPPTKEPEKKEPAKKGPTPPP